ncbi:hypothetical protein NBRC116601_05470 [Cognatishimia sp. WU-CL00825]|uniref:winged helix-turn-helix transcriptional regulator n=1 Tax=Cognatishimia sp. WU-CL00825 TaxID=3127658 RepID=UPI003104389E
MEHNSCPVDPLLKTITGRWTTYVIWLLVTEGPLRFGEMLGLMPTISAKVLTERLRTLESAGIVLRKQMSTAPPAVSYELTAQGRDLHTAIKALHGVAVHWQDQGWTPDHGFPQVAAAE